MHRKFNMNYAKKLHLITFVVYSIMASIGSKFLNIPWIHLLNALILSAILYHLLEWKYDWVEEGDNNE